MPWRRMRLCWVAHLLLLFQRYGERPMAGAQAAAQACSCGGEKIAIRGTRIRLGVAIREKSDRCAAVLDRPVDATYGENFLSYMDDTIHTNLQPISSSPDPRRRFKSHICRRRRKLVAAATERPKLTQAPPT